MTLAAGEHTIAVQFTNDLYAWGCDRNLRVDYVAITPSASPPPVAGEFPDGSRRVWVHEMLQFPWFNLEGAPYGADHPLVLQPSYASSQRPSDTAQRYIDSGVTGVQLLFFDGVPDDVVGHTQYRLAQFDGTGMELALCLFPQGDNAETLRVLRDFLSAAAGHPAAARIKVDGVDRYVVFIYGARYAMGPSGFTQLRSAIEAAGLPVYLLGDVVSAIAYNGDFDPDRVEPFAKASVNAYLPVFDATWTFDEGVDMAWNPLVAALTAGGRLFAGGPLPGYNRESMATGGYVDAEATAQYRRQWQYALDSGLAWNTLVSWNDFSERHTIQPTSEWNWTRADITAFYSAKLRRIAPPAHLTQPQLYVTVPQRINIGQSQRLAEALVLNGGTAPVEVSIQLRDGAGHAWGNGASVSVAAGHAGAAVIAFSPATLPAGRFLRAYAVSTDSSGATPQTVSSAPIVVYAANEQASGFEYERTKYYSIPARMALPGTVDVEVSGSPLQPGATATVIPPAGAAVRFAEVLQNNFLVQHLFASPNRTVPIPLTNGQTIINQNPVNTPASGFYMARVIDEAERVGYSDPIYVAP